MQCNKYRQTHPEEQDFHRKPLNPADPHGNKKEDPMLKGRADFYFKNAALHNMRQSECAERWEQREADCSREKKILATKP